MASMKDLGAFSKFLNITFDPCEGRHRVGCQSGM